MKGKTELVKKNGNKETPKKASKQEIQKTTIGDKKQSGSSTSTYRTYVAEQQGVTNAKKGSGSYFYTKKPTEAGFNPEKHREFVEQNSVGDVRRHMAANKKK